MLISSSFFLLVLTFSHQLCGVVHGFRIRAKIKNQGRGRGHQYSTLGVSRPSARWTDRDPEHSWIMDTTDANLPIRKAAMSVAGGEGCFGAIFKSLDATAAHYLNSVIEARRGFKLLGSGGFKHVVLVRKYSGNENWEGRLGALNLYSEEIANNATFMAVFLKAKAPDPNADLDAEQDQQVKLSNGTGRSTAKQLEMSVRIMRLFEDNGYIMRLEDESPLFGISDQRLPAMSGATAFVTEFAPYGDLAGWLQGFAPGLHASDQPATGDATVKCFDYLAQRLFSAVTALHDANYQHCDLKPENFLIRKFVDIGGGVMCPEAYLSDLDTVTALDDPVGCEVGTPSYWPFGMSPQGIMLRRSEDPATRKFNEYFSIGAILVEAFFPIRWLRYSTGGKKPMTVSYWRKRGESYSRRFEAQEILDKLDENAVPRAGAKASKDRTGLSWPKGLDQGPWHALGEIYGLTVGSKAFSKEDLIAQPRFRAKYELLQLLVSHDFEQKNQLLHQLLNDDASMANFSGGAVQKRFDLVKQIVDGERRTE